MHLGRSRIRISAVSVVLCSLLSACGGGGGSSTGGPLPGPTPCPSGYTGTAPNCVASQSTTTAKGMLVDDVSGAPLAGVNVEVQPWISYPTPGPSPTPVAVSTTAADGSFTVSQPNGTYMLVIGSDSPSDMTRPTIHDKIILGGQTILTAPTPAPIALVTPSAIQTSGKYRLSTIDTNTELPCITAFQNHRASLNLPKAVVDQWLVENVRTIFAHESNASYTSRARRSK